MPLAAPQPPLTNPNLKEQSLEEPRFRGAGLKSASELSRERTEQQLSEEDAFSTGLPDLDRLLLGGLPRGQLVELMGRGTSGRFSCVLSLLAASTQRGEAVALVDVGDQLDPRLAEEFGIDLGRLLWVRPQRIEEALSAAEILLAGAFPAIVLDLGLPPVPGGRGRQIWWVRLARAVRRHRSALLVSSPYSVSSGTASVLLEAYSRQFLWRGTGSSPRLLSGLDLQVDRSKSRAEARPDSGRFRLNRVTEQKLWKEAEITGRKSKTEQNKPQPVATSPRNGPIEAIPTLPVARTFRAVPSAQRSWSYRRPAILPENADQALALGPRRSAGD